MRSTGDLDPTAAVRIEREGPVATILLNRPAVKNAVNLALATGLETALAQAGADVRVIVIRGVGGSFCVGGDFDEVSRLRAEGAAALRPLFEHFGRACSLIGELPVPVVAAVEGYAMAGGFELMQACDIAIVRDDAVIADNHTNFAQVPGGGGSQRLPRLVGLHRALGHILTGDRLSGTQAVAWGLAYRSAAAADFDRALDELVGNLAAKDPVSLARTKRLVRQGAELPLADGLELERTTVVEHLQGREASAGIDRFSRKDL